MRYDKNSGEPIKEFVLNKDPFNKSKILIGEKNFGCGSSREHAPWALLDFGIRVIIAPSFADIFYNNCFKNGILPICLPDKIIKELSEYAANHKEIEINLDEQKITKEDNQPIEFEIDSFRKECLINGYDDIALTLKKNNHIEKFIEQYRSKNSWLF